MGGAPHLFDRDLQRRRLARALAGGEDAFFLVRRCAEDLSDRLAAVLRRFPTAADIATPTRDAVGVLSDSGKVDTILRVAPVIPRTAEAGMAAVADEERLPLAPASLDLAVSLLALQAVNDLPGTLVQIRRALRPDGLFVGCLLGGESLTELRHCFARAESEVEGGASPRVAPFADIRDMGGLLQRAGFALPVADALPFSVSYASAFDLMRDLRGMGEGNALAGRLRRMTRRGVMLRAAEIYAERFGEGGGRVTASFEVIVLTGWSPGPGQPQPLRPGSAAGRLAAALGVEERPLDRPGD
jgi:SAM-dependent methyltransferase